MSNKGKRVITAANLIQKYLRNQWIVDGCKGERVMGCASCTMTRLHEDLDMLIYEIEHDTVHPPKAD